MKRIFLATAAFLVVAGQAGAADLPVKDRPMPVAAIPSWTGFYVGLEVGGGWGNTDMVATIPSGINFNPGDRFGTNHISGVLGGGAIGADYQFAGSWVVGAKGSFDGANINGNQNTLSTTGPNNVNSTQKLNWLAMAVGRLGYTPMNNLLLYADGGGAWTNSRRSAITTAIAGGALVSTSSGSENLSGWTVGAGAEYKLTRNVSVLVEYNYIDFGTKATTTNFLTGVPVGAVVGRNISTTLNVVKGGINYRF